MTQQYNNQHFNENSMTLSRQIGRAIATHRRKNNLTQAQVAERLGLSNDAISRMERGSITPSIHRLMQFAQIFGCHTADFLGQASPVLTDQAQRVMQLLMRLNENEREQFLVLVEEMVKWRLSDDG